MLRMLRPGVLPRCFSIVSALFLGALLLSSCDSGADFSSLDDLSSDGNVVAKVRVWYEDQIQFAVSENLSKISGDDDSLAVAKFVEKFPPDWKKAVMLSRKDGDRSMVATLGQYTDEKYDTTFHHVRIILVDLDPSDKISSGNIVVFSSRDELHRDRFDTYAKQYLEKDFGNVEMIVSRYTVRFEAVDAFLYRSGQIPLPISTRFEKIQVNASGKLGKLGTSASIAGPDETCYQWCHIQETEICVGEGADEYCSTTWYITCSTIHCSGSGGGGGGGGGGSGGGGGGDGSDGDGDDDEDKCSCSDEKKCDLAEEYGDSTNWPCDKFNTISREWRLPSNGYESKHGGLGYISRSLSSGFSRIRRVYGRQFYITPGGGYRCPTGNANIRNAAPGSQHKLGTAVDFNPPYVDLNTYGGVDNVPYWTHSYKKGIADYAENTLGAGWTSLYEGRNHVHIDWR